MKKRTFFSLLLCIAVLVTTLLPTKAANLPSLSGKLVFHRYSDYDAEDSQLYLYDFSKGSLTCLSKNMTGVHHAMNATFSPDGKSITFMGISDEDQWDIYLYTFQDHMLKNLTASDAGRHEDPKFSPDGKSICFKSCPDGKEYAQLYTYRLSTGKLTKLTHANTEHSMPYFSKTGKYIYYVRGDGKDSQIWKYKNGKNSRIYKRTNVECYYPIVAKSTGDVFFSRWYSADNHADQIYRYRPSTGKIKRLSFNNPDYDTSDYCEVSKNYGIVSSTKDGDTYDLFLVSVNGKKMTNLNTYYKEFNSGLQELGADYHE